MKKFIIKFLTLQLLIFSTPEIYSVVNHEEAKTHSHISIDADKEAIVVEKKDNVVSIKTLNSGLFELMKAKLESIKLSQKYFSSISYKVPTTKNNVSEIKVILKDKKVELFSFYKERERRHVLDFWVEADDFKQKLNKKIANTKVEKKSAKKAAVKKPKAKKIPPALVKKNVLLPKKAKTYSERNKTAKGISRSKKNPQYRDFRYGASFIWDYKGLSPEYKTQVNLTRKTPEYFYPIKDREFKKSEKEAHVQLSINLFRKEKWGLMYKSIKLYTEKYGNDANADINEYLKANAILKSNILEGNRDPKKMAINMLSNIADRSTIYDMKKGIYKYLLEFYSQNNQHVEALKEVHDQILDESASSTRGGDSYLAAAKSIYDEPPEVSGNPGDPVCEKLAMSQKFNMFFFGTGESCGITPLREKLTKYYKDMADNDGRYPTYYTTSYVVNPELTESNLMTGYAPGPRQGANDDGSWVKPYGSGATQLAKRNFYSTKFFAIDRVTEGGSQPYENPGIFFESKTGSSFLQPAEDFLGIPQVNKLPRSVLSEFESLDF